MYLCGYSLEQMLEKELPKKLKWQGINLTFEFAILAMFELKDNESAMLINGEMIFSSGPCAWVEYVNDSGQRMVKNYCSDWVELPYIVFHNKFLPDTDRIYLHYIFWTRFTSRLYQLMQKPETSYVLGDLSVIRPKFKNGKIYDITDFGHRYSDKIEGTCFIPTVINNPNGTSSLLNQELFDSLMK